MPTSRGALGCAADGVKIYDSGLMTSTSATQKLNLDITGVQTLRLYVSDAGDGPDFDHADWAKRAYVDDAKYREMYARSVSDPNGFWGEQARRLDWIKPFHKVENVSFAQPGLVASGSTPGPVMLPPLGTSS